MHVFVFCKVKALKEKIAVEKGEGYAPDNQKLIYAGKMPKCFVKCSICDMGWSDDACLCFQLTASNSDRFAYDLKPDICKDFKVEKEAFIVELRPKTSMHTIISNWLIWPDAFHTYSYAPFTHFRQNTGRCQVCCRVQNWREEFCGDNDNKG